MNEVASRLPARASRRAVAQASFATVAERHLDDVYAYLVYMVGDRAAAEDLTGETFERALRRWPSYDARRASPRTWLCQLARGAALDHLRAESRRRRREERYAVDERGEAPPPPDVGLSPELERAVRSLPAGEREVIALRVVLELDTEEAARLLGVSATACTTRLSRALTKLQASLEESHV
jgi:RNA polymerase sigma-70 factor, ECF subfamily